MISEVVMPQMGADMTEGTIVRWLKHEGEAVERGEIIAEIETDKANVEIEAFESGMFRKALAGEGDVVPVGDVIAIIAGAAGRHLEVRERRAAPVGAETRRTGRGACAPIAEAPQTPQPSTPPPLPARRPPHRPPLRPPSTRGCASRP